MSELFNNYEFICTKMNNVFGMAARYYEKDKLTFSCVSVPFIQDPVNLYLDKILPISDHIGYYITPHFELYGIINVASGKYVFGPARHTPYSEQEIKEIAFELGIKNNIFKKFEEAIKNVKRVPFRNVIQTLSLINYFLNNGEEISLIDVFVKDVEQEIIKKKINSEEIIVNSSIEEPSQIVDVYANMALEKMLLENVKNGNICAIREFMQQVPAVNAGDMAKSELRQAKNTFIVIVTLLTRAAIDGGMDIKDAMNLSDEYIQKAELAQNDVEISNLNYRSIIDFTERVNDIKNGTKNTELEKEVKRYIYHHLSEAITVEDLAKALYISRSHLSTIFKQKTGENLSQFVMRQKIEEAKKLLKTSKKSAIDIAFYLGFSSQSHFSRTFKEYVHMTPNEYRHSTK